MDLKNIKLGLEEHKPTIFLGLGILASAVSLVLSARAGAKTKDVVEPANTEIAKIKSEKTDENKKTTKRALTKVYTKTGWQLTKLYAPAVITYGVSVALTLKSHTEMSDRLSAATAACLIYQTTLNTYRKRVAEKYGEEAERDIFNGKKTEVVKTVDKDGNEIEKEVVTQDPLEYSILYGAGTSKLWEDNGPANIDTLLQAWREANLDLRTHRGRKLWDVLFEDLQFYPEVIPDALKEASNYVGWIYDPSDIEKAHGDNFISFGVCDELGNLTPEATSMLMGDSTEIWLTFNVDGIIISPRKLKNGKQSKAIGDVYRKL